MIVGVNRDFGDAFKSVDPVLDRQGLRARFRLMRDAGMPRMGIGVE